MKRWIIIGIIIILVGGGLYLYLSPPRFLLNTIKKVDPTPEVGRKLVEKYGCRNCHMIGGIGGMMAPPLDGITQKVGDPALVTLRLWLRNPKAIKPGTAMPNFKLSDSEIEAIIEYLKALDEGKEVGQ